MKAQILYFFICIFFVSNFAYTQSKKIDSLRQVLKTDKEDTNKVKILNTLSQNVGWRVGNYDTAFYYAKKALHLAKKTNFKEGVATAYNNIGITYASKGLYAKALNNLKKTLKIRKKFNDKKGMARSHVNIGVVYYSLGNHVMALKNYQDALKIAEKIKDKYAVAACYGNIGNIQNDIGNYDKALKNFKATLKISKELEDDQRVALSYNNMGLVYINQKKYNEALKIFEKVQKIYKNLKDKSGIATALVNIGLIYKDQGFIQKALNTFRASLKLRKQTNDNAGMARSYNNLGSMNLILHKNHVSKKYFQLGLKFAKITGAKNLIRDSYFGLSDIDSALGNYQSAYENYKMYVVYRDSIKNNENTKKITQLQMQFKFDQQKVADSIANAKEKEIQQAKIAQQNAEIQTKQNMQYALFGGLALVLVFAGFMYNRFKKTQNQKKVIEIQKSLVEEKNKEISDSINYAKRIQEAILPSRFSLTENLKNGFVLFKPKDIVSGDFYWLEKVGDTTYFASADCTGHGVPGAMVSVICSNALSKALLEENITETGKLLDRTRELVAERFAGSGEDVKDGMDISLCKLEDNKLQWSGANNPLWIIRNSNMFTERSQSEQSNNNQEVAERSRRHLEEIKPDKQPVGKTDNPQPFTTHNIELYKGDTIYIFTDGYADQFGGEKGKKFKYKPMKDLLLSLQDKTLEEQKTTLNNSFEDWKGNLEQVDDVCVIGVRL